jgi:hypothetical protein
MKRYLKSILLTWALVLPALVMAQVPQLPRKKLTAQQLQTVKLRDDAVQKTMADFNQKLEPELKKQPQYTQMMRDLERLRTITDPAQRKAEVAKYQATYRPVMQASLGAARLDMNKLARDLEAADPDFKFDISPNFTIKRMAKSMAKRQPMRVQLSPGPRVETVKLTNFKESHEKSGSLASGGSHNFNGSGQETFAAAAVAGQCTVDTEQELEYTVPADVTKATLIFKCKFDLNAYGLGVLGTAGASANADFQIVLGTRPLIYEPARVEILAPIAYATVEEDGQEYEEQITLSPGSKFTIVLSASSFVICALPAYGDSRAKIKQVSVEVRLER